MNILLLLFLFQNDPSVISMYLQNYCHDKGGDGFMTVIEGAVFITCKDENSSKIYLNPIGSKK